jgi:hypothetical protein
MNQCSSIGDCRSLPGGTKERGAMVKELDMPFAQDQLEKRRWRKLSVSEWA